MGVFVKFVEWVDFGPQKTCLNFESDPEPIPDTSGS